MSIRTANQQELANLHTGIALLAQYRIPHFLSLGTSVCVALLATCCTAIGMITLPLASGITVILLLGILEHVYAGRISFDLALLHRLARQADALEAGLTQLDHSLVQLLGIPTQKTGRSIDSRLRACLQLLKIQTTLCLLQYSAIVVMTWAGLAAS